jgi:hypothetical protein
MQVSDFQELKCDQCKRVLGFIWENDLNGTYIVCSQECAVKATEWWNRMRAQIDAPRGVTLQYSMRIYVRKEE